MFQFSIITKYMVHSVLSYPSSNISKLELVFDIFSVSLSISEEQITTNKLYFLNNKFFDILLLYGFILIDLYSPPKCYTNSNIIIINNVLYNKIQIIKWFTVLYYLVQQILFFFCSFFNREYYSCLFLKILTLHNVSHNWVNLVSFKIRNLSKTNKSPPFF